MCTNIITESLTCSIQSFWVVRTGFGQMTSLTTDKTLGVWVITQKTATLIRQIIRGLIFPYILGVQASFLTHTHGRIYFSTTSLDFMFGRTTTITNTAAHLFIVIRIRAVGEPVSRLPAVEANLDRKFERAHV